MGDDDYGEEEGREGYEGGMEGGRELKVYEYRPPPPPLLRDRNKEALIDVINCGRGERERESPVLLDVSWKSHEGIKLHNVYPLAGARKAKGGVRGLLMRLKKGKIHKECDGGHNGYFFLRFKRGYDPLRKG